MKILALSDEVVPFIYSPQVRQRFGDVDLVLGCGDLPFYYLEFVVNMLDKPVYYVPGNHDKRFQYLSDGRIVTRAEGCEDVDGRAVSVNDGAGRLLLAGLGGSLRYNNDGVHQYTQVEMAGRIFALTPALLANRLRHGRPLDMLIAHSPPRGIHDASDRAHTGFDSFLTLMRLFRPRWLLHGHAHVYRQDTITETRFEGTTVINVYPYRVIEWGAEHV